VPNPEGDIKVI
jgi:hypothetical protein